MVNVDIGNGSDGSDGIRRSDEKSKMVEDQLVIKIRLMDKGDNTLQCLSDYDDGADVTVFDTDTDTIH